MCPLWRPLRSAHVDRVGIVGGPEGCAESVPYKREWLPSTLRHASYPLQIPADPQTNQNIQAPVPNIVTRWFLSQSLEV